jgi:chromosome segregation ATPase
MCIYNFRLQAKIRRLETDVAQMDRQLGIPRQNIADKEEKEGIVVLQEQVSRLKSQLSAAQQKITQLTDQLEKKKKEVDLLKRTAYLARKPAQNRTNEIKGTLEVLPGKNPMFDGRTTTNNRPLELLPAMSISDEPNLLEVAQKYKIR